MDSETVILPGTAESNLTSEESVQGIAFNVSVDDKSKSKQLEEVIQFLNQTPVSSPGLSSIPYNDIQRKGWICIYIGPMYSGKTTKLFEAIKRNLSGTKSKKCLFVTYQKASEGIPSIPKGRLTYLECLELKDICDEMKNYDVIAIDEAQFFNDIVEICDKLAEEGKEVLVAGLDGDYRREPFGEILKLIPKAEKVKKLNARCNFCGNKGSFSYRITDETKVVVIGKDKYTAACRTCYSSEMGKKALPAKELIGESLTEETKNNEGAKTEIKDKAQCASDGNQEPALKEKFQNPSQATSSEGAKQIESDSPIKFEDEVISTNNQTKY